MEQQHDITAAAAPPKFGHLAHGVAHEKLALREALGRIRAVARTPEQAIGELQAMIAEREADLANIAGAATPYRAEVSAKARQIVTASLQDIRDANPIDNVKPPKAPGAGQ